MNPYEPPRTPLLNEAKSEAQWINFVAGAASYYVYHHLAGVLGSATWPAPFKAAMRLYRPITMPLMDLLLIGTPMVLAFVIVAFAWFRLLGGRTRRALILFSVGWLVPMLAIVFYGEIESPGMFLGTWGQWPHVAIVQCSPLLGIWLGFRLSAMQAPSSSHAA